MAVNAKISCISAFGFKQSLHVYRRTIAEQMIYAVYIVIVCLSSQASVQVDTNSSHVFMSYLIGYMFLQDGPASPEVIDAASYSFRDLQHAPHLPKARATLCH